MVYIRKPITAQVHKYTGEHAWNLPGWIRDACHEVKNWGQEIINKPLGCYDAQTKKGIVIVV